MRCSLCKFMAESQKNCRSGNRLGRAQGRRGGGRGEVALTNGQELGLRAALHHRAFISFRAARQQPRSKCRATCHNDRWTPELVP